MCSFWLEKSTHVHAVFPANCTDDLLFIEENNCTELLWPKVCWSGGLALLSFPFHKELLYGTGFSRVVWYRLFS